MTFRVGQEVVCVDAGGWHRTYYGEKNVVKGVVYTIRAFGGNAGNGKSGILLAEIVNPVVNYFTGPGEVAFEPHQFRPVVKTDISIFQSMLVPAPKQRVEA